jgi:hypothetical protein
MENSDSRTNLKRESLTKQFDLIVAETNLSHPQAFGQQTFNRTSISYWLTGWHSTNASSPSAYSDNSAAAPLAPHASAVPFSSVSSRFATQLSLSTRAAKGELRAAAQLADELQAQALAADAFGRFIGRGAGAAADALAQPLATPLAAVAGGFECYRDSVRAFEAACGRFTDATLAWARLLAASCAAGDAAAPHKIAAACLAVRS